MDTSSSVPHGIVCTPEQYAHSLRDNSIHCLTRGESIGLTLVAESGLISLLALSYVFFVIIRNVIWRIRKSSRDQDRWHAFHAKPIDLLILSLFFADFLQGVGAVMELKWVVDANVHAGEFCSAQGIFLQLGGTGVAMTTLMISVYTFHGIWLGRNIKSIRITAVFVSATWVFIILMVIVGNTVNRGPGTTPYVLPTPYWCWISEDYLQWRIWGQYFWYWITLAFSIAIYVPLWLWSSGNIIIDDHTWWKFKFQRAGPNADQALRGTRRRSLIMLAYPFVYCILIMPLSVVRWIGFVQERSGVPNSIPSAATQLVFATLSLSGAFNVVLLLTTRPNAVLFENDVHFESRRGSSPLLASNKHARELIREGQDEDESELVRLPPRS